MEPGIVKIADDNDFEMLKMLVDDHSNWKIEYERKEDGTKKVWTKSTTASSLKMVKVHTLFKDVHPNTVFDVLHDPDYRKTWDEHMLASIEIGYLNPNNDVSYYALSCPAPIKNRDFVLQRSWLDTGNEKLILNHSVHHKDYQPKKGFIRGISYLTGFVLRKTDKGCFLGYISQTDPRGKLPPWLVNKVSQKFAPKVVDNLKKAANGYDKWKMAQPNPYFKPWVSPEQTLQSPRISTKDCVQVHRTRRISDCDDDD
nr:unnamed protein product [Callosobruchus analis]